MTDWFYSLPLWLGSAVVLGAALAIGLAGSLGVQKLLRLKVNSEEREVAINLMQVVAAYVGIMIAFAGVQVWQDFTDSKNAVAEEAARLLRGAAAAAADPGRDGGRVFHGLAGERTRR